MATAKQTDRPGLGVLDAQPKKITVDSALNEVSADSEAAAFSYLPADLERVRARREELGYNDRERVLRESRKAELAAAKRRLATLQDQVDALESDIAAGDADEKKATAKAGAEK